ncbi:MAG: hypothetical protein K2N37_03100 [Lachnospiraceae bacterium]|nr:hypothetical protein [Lachnospiraceae bacterium]
MLKRKHKFLSIIMGISLLFLTGCGRDSASDSMESVNISDTDNAENDITEAETDTAALSEESQREAEEEPEEESEQKEAEDEANDTPIVVPQLPDTCSQLADFVPEGWELMDSVELDFNEDGSPDYVGVLESTLADGEELGYQGCPRILFAIASDGTNQYCLDFQDINLINTREEGGVMGDPYAPLTAEGVSFSTHTYGGSQWRWSKDHTYTYREGIWWYTSSEETFGYLDYTTDYSRNDWDSGVGIRKKRSSEFDDMEEGWESAEYDVIYEVSLDDPMTLEQAGKRGPLASNRVTDWEVKKTVLAENVEISEDMIESPDEAYFQYCDEDFGLYSFHTGSDTEKGFYYLAMYCWQDKVLYVLAQEETDIDDLECYKGKIYYSTEIVEKIAYKDQIEEKEDTIGIRLNRMELEGDGKETIFEYRYPGTEQEILEDRVPYLSLIYEISGDEIVAEVYIGDEQHPFYRMNTDGSKCKKIGQMPEE